MLRCWSLAFRTLAARGMQSALRKTHASAVTKGLALKVLVTGSTGYVGSRLIAALTNDGHEVSAGLRNLQKAKSYEWPANVRAVRFDVTDMESLKAATAGVDVVVYLVHSMAGDDFVARDREAAEALALACEVSGVGKIVYLSGLIPGNQGLSDHLKSRLEVEQIFGSCLVPAITVRAAIIIGNGSTSFELVRTLVNRLPVVPVPRWMTGNVQPVAASDVIRVLCAAVRAEPVDGHFDIGGPDILPYAGLLSLYADCAGLKRPQVRIPFIPARVVGELGALITGMPRGTVTSLVESLHGHMVAEKSDYSDVFGFGPEDLMGVRQAIMTALEPSADGTRRTGEPLHGAPTDPDWAGP